MDKRSMQIAIIASVLIALATGAFTLCLWLVIQFNIWFIPPLMIVSFYSAFTAFLIAFGKNDN